MFIVRSRAVSDVTKKREIFVRPVEEKEKSAEMQL